MCYAQKMDTLKIIIFLCVVCTTYGNNWASQRRRERLEKLGNRQPLFKRTQRIQLAKKEECLCDLVDDRCPLDCQGIVLSNSRSAEPGTNVLDICECKDPATGRCVDRINPCPADQIVRKQAKREECLCDLIDGQCPTECPGISFQANEPKPGMSVLDICRCKDPATGRCVDRINPCPADQIERRQEMDQRKRVNDALLELIAKMERTYEGK